MMKLRSSLYAFLIAALLVATCAGAAAAAPTSTHTSSNLLRNDSAADRSTPTPPTTWFGQYYDNMFLAGRPEVTRDDAAIDFDWGPDSPDPRISRDLFSVRWTRSLWLDTGTWRFTVRTDDGVRLWVDSVLLIDQWHNQPQATYTADAPLGAGYHTVILEYFEFTGDAIARLSYELWGDTCENCFPPLQSSLWRGQYYGNMFLQGEPDMTRDDAAIDFDWGQGRPERGLEKDLFSVRWTRSLWLDKGTWRFTMTSDDGVRVWVDNMLVIDEWHEQPVMTYSADVPLGPGYHTIRVEYFESFGYAVARLSYQLLGAGCVNCPGAVATGPWLGQYFDTLLPQGGADVTRTDAAIDFDWGSGSPDLRIPQDMFSARWTQTARFDTAIYRFHAIADDGVRLYIDGKVVMDEWANNPGTEFAREVKVRAGKHAVKVEYYEYGYDAKIKVWWEKLN
jgi:hypothetical protein